MAIVGWEHFEHAADIGVRGFGGTIATAFEQVALATSAAVTDLSALNPRASVRVHCSAEDHDNLLYEWLNAIIYEMATRKMLFCEYRVEIQGDSLNGEAAGEAIDVERHQPAVEVKGATYTELAVRRDDGRWTAQCVIDV
jgi:SHS2 domain-containing protein